MNARYLHQNAMKHLWFTCVALLSSVLLTGCGALWESAFPTPDPRGRVSFHLASYQPQGGWAMHSGPLGNPQVYVQPQALMTAADVLKATALVDRLKNYYVGVEVNAAAAARLKLATANITGPGYALIMLEEGKLISVMPLEGPMTSNQFGIPVKSAVAAKGLMDFLSPK